MATSLKTDSYSGDSSYMYVDKLVKANDRELMIISPYISNFYIKKLVKESGRKRIRVITSESSNSYKGSTLKNYISKNMKKYIKATIFMAILVAISLYLHFNYTTPILIGITAILVVIMILKSRKTDENLKVKVIKDKFVHEKVYIGDDTAIVGSANLTFNGMHRNVEHIDVIKDNSRINDLRDHFETLWSKY
jgi:phosphatidylserine/phosphatidylglycerophosphate/cardiolipin synthase-like enzyme